MNRRYCAVLVGIMMATALMGISESPIFPQETLDSRGVDSMKSAVDSTRENVVSSEVRAKIIANISKRYNSQRDCQPRFNNPCLTIPGTPDQIKIKQLQSGKYEVTGLSLVTMLLIYDYNPGISVITTTERLTLITGATADILQEKKKPESKFRVVLPLDTFGGGRD